MRLPVDDEIYQVNSVWLGPRGTTLPWRARYGAYAVGATIFLLILWAERRLGVPVGLWTLAYDLVGTIGATRALMRSVDHDRPVRVMLAVFAHELSAPREQPPGAQATFRPGQVRIRSRRPLLAPAPRPRPAAVPPQPRPRPAPAGPSRPRPAATRSAASAPVPVIDVTTLPPPTGAPIRSGPPLPQHAHLLTPRGSHGQDR